jgi:hypothetical protein
MFIARQQRADKGAPMPAGLTLALLAQAVSADPAAAKAPDPKPPPAATINVTTGRQDGCANPLPSADTQQIVICAPKSQGYRLNPDVMEAKREVHGAGPLKRPDNFKDYPCASGVGPAPCFSPGINLIAAALTAAEMAKRLSEGKEIGSMFITDPRPDEYHLYLAAKARREAREAQAAAEAAGKKAAAAKAERAKAAAPAEVKEPAKE